MKFTYWYAEFKSAIFTFQLYILSNWYSYTKGSPKLFFLLKLEVCNSLNCMEFYISYFVYTWKTDCKGGIR